jgi:hypothetical protein
VSSAAIHAKARAAKRAPLDPFAIASMQVDAKKKIFFVDDLRHRWERIVLGDRA